MRAADKWIDYELLDASRGERLERWGDILLIRPDPQVMWCEEIRTYIRHLGCVMLVPRYKLMCRKNL